MNSLYPILSLAGSPSLNASFATSDPLAHVSTKSSSSLWHNRLGHPNSDTLQFIDHSLNLPFSQISSSLWEHCLHGEMKKSPFSHSSSISLYPLEIIHSYVWGPASEPSVDGYKYYVSFVDDMSRYTWFFPLIRKSDVFPIFVKYKTLVENLLSSKIKTFRSGGGEFVNHNFRSFFSTNGILHQKSRAYTPQ